MPSNSSFNNYVCIAYTSLFPSIPPPSYKDLFSNIPTNAVFEIISHFMAKIHINELDIEPQKEIMKIWCGRFSEENKNKLESAYIKLFSESQGKVMFFNNISSLCFLQKALLNHHNGETRNLTAEEELNLFKAYLLATEEWTKEQADKMGLNSNQNIVEFILPFKLPYQEIQQYKDFRNQFVKALYFFKYIESDKFLNQYLSPFLQKSNTKSWQEYLYNVLSGYTIVFRNKHSILIVEDKDFQDFLVNWSIRIEGFVEKIDFLSLRDKPIYRMNKNQFAFFNFNFLIDKMFQGLQFDFSVILKQQGVVSDFLNFKSKYYSKEFCERYMFYGLMKYLVGKRKATQFDGDSIAKAIGEEGPDYYLRIGSKVFIFEFKDALLSAATKHSYNFQKIKDDLHEKFVKNARGEAKGVGQLARFISAINKDGCEFDKFNTQEVKIYPVLVVTDDAFNSFGINFLLNQLFQQEIRGKLINGNLKDLVVIHIDTLVEYQDELHDRKITCVDTIEKYYAFIKSPQNVFDGFLSYAQFLKHYLKYKGIQTSSYPRVLAKELPSIIKKKT